MPVCRAAMSAGSCLARVVGLVLFAVRLLPDAGGSAVAAAAAGLNLALLASASGPCSNPAAAIGGIEQRNGSGDWIGDSPNTWWREPSNHAAREGMILAATLGGMAFANSSVALVHGMSRPIGAIFHVSHGLSNAVLLPGVTRFSLVDAPERYATVARTMGLATVADSADAAEEKLTAGLAALNARLAVPRLGGAGE